MVTLSLLQMVQGLLVRTFVEEVDYRNSVMK